MVVGGKEEEGGGDEGAREDEEEALLTEEVGGGGSEEGGGAGLLLRGLAGVGGIVGVGRDLVLLVQAGLLVELLHGGNRTEGRGGSLVVPRGDHTTGSMDGGLSGVSRGAGSYFTYCQVTRTGRRKFSFF